MHDKGILSLKNGKQIDLTWNLGDLLSVKPHIVEGLQESDFKNRDLEKVL